MNGLESLHRDKACSINGRAGGRQNADHGEGMGIVGLGQRPLRYAVSQHQTIAQFQIELGSKCSARNELEGRGHRLRGVGIPRIAPGPALRKRQLSARCFVVLEENLLGAPDRMAPMAVAELNGECPGDTAEPAHAIEDRCIDVRRGSSDLKGVVEQDLARTRSGCDDEIDATHRLRKAGSCIGAQLNHCAEKGGRYGHRAGHEHERGAS